MLLKDKAGEEGLHQDAHTRIMIYTLIYTDLSIIWHSHSEYLHTILVVAQTLTPILGTLIGLGSSGRAGLMFFVDVH